MTQIGRYSSTAASTSDNSGPEVSTLRRIGGALVLLILGAAAHQPSAHTNQPFGPLA
jgi:hypothetical protein